MKKNRKRIRNVLSVMVMLLAFGSVAYASGGEPASGGCDYIGIGNLAGDRMAESG